MKYVLKEAECIQPKEYRPMRKPLYRLALLASVASAFVLTSPLFASETDDRIESSARETYVFRTYLKNDAIQLQSRDGLVTLTGTVADPSHRSLAGATVAGLPGVTAVDNKLTENGQGPAAKSDAGLIAKVKTTLMFHANVNASATEVTAENGVVTLRGQAATLAQKDLTAEFAGDVDGVTNVINEMTVADSSAKTGNPTMPQKMDAMARKIDDASITALVKTALTYHRSTSSLNTTVTTKDGVVTLEGKARTGAEKELTGNFASDVHGVRQVNNNIIVQ